MAAVSSSTSTSCSHSARAARVGVVVLLGFGELRLELPESGAVRGARLVVEHRIGAERRFGRDRGIAGGSYQVAREIPPCPGLGEECGEVPDALGVLHASGASREAQQPDPVFPTEDADAAWPLGRGWSHTKRGQLGFGPPSPCRRADALVVGQCPFVECDGFIRVFAFGGEYAEVMVNRTGKVNGAGGHHSESRVREQRLREAPHDALITDRDPRLRRRCSSA